MDPNKIDRLHEANAAFSERLNTASANPTTDEENSLMQEQFVNGAGPDSPLDGNIKLNEFFEQVKIKRSQGRNQVANSVKLYDRRTKVYLSIALISNVVVDDKAPELSDEVKKVNREQLATIQYLFDDFLANVHEKLS